MQSISKTEANVINYLWREGNQPKYYGEVARDLNIPERTVYEAFRSLYEKEILQIEIEGRPTLYTLTKTWKEIAEAAKMFIAETDEAPLLSYFRNKIQSIKDNEREIFEQIGKLKKITKIPIEQKKQITEIINEEKMLQQDFIRKKQSLQEEIGLAPEVPSIAAFSGFDNFDDLMIRISYRKQIDLSQNLESLLKEIKKLNEIRNKLRISIDGIEKAFKEGILKKEKYIEKKAHYDIMLKILEDFFNNLREFKE
jgi:DNA-binding transcriptional ArsR family regulator